MLVLMVFANPRILAASIIDGKLVWQMNIKEYIHAFFSQIEWDLAIDAFILAVVFADKVNSRRREKELLAVNMDLNNKIVKPRYCPIRNPQVSQ